jgi:hypothetical protein
VCNIIQRYANNTDGYVALYEIMERIHPLLNPDAKLQAPLSINCTDIHDYSNQFHSYIPHNSLENVHFTQRRQINIFLDGLDSSYSMALRQIRQQLRNWPETNSDPPPPLQLEALPRTIKTIMVEDCKAGTVRVLRGNQNQANGHQKSSNPNKPRFPKDITAQAFTDVQCNYCKCYGHKSITCERMAQVIILQELLPKISDKTHTKLLEHYSKTQQD